MPILFHAQPAPGESSFDVQHYLLSFGLDATCNQIAILVLAGLTGKKEQIAYPCRFRIGAAFTREGSVVVLGDLSLRAASRCTDRRRATSLRIYDGERIRPKV